jgi:ferredoxin
MIRLKKNMCDFCGICVGICPENCIELKEMELAIDRQVCTSCLKCTWVCPLQALYKGSKNAVKK